MDNIILKHVLLNAIQYNGKADFKAVVGKILFESPNLKKDLKKITPEIKKTISEVNHWNLEKQKKKLKEMGIEIEKKKIEEKKELPPLPNVKKYKKIVMRMAPFPSGPLHIGNTRMVILNDEYVKRYEGKLLLVIDDTIGSEEKIPIPEGYDMIEEGLKWLGVKWHEKYYKSDRMDLFYKWARELIKRGYAYVCTCAAEILRENRRKRIVCDCRSNSIEKNLEKWRQMLEGKFKKGGAVVRLKTDIKHPNPAFRDRVLLRISEREHPRIGRKYYVWPMLEYSWAIDDHFLGMTHILRGKDLIIEDMMEEYIWNLFDWKRPELLHHGLLGIKGLKLSKSKARRAIEREEYSGWDDPRTWSLQSLRKRGFRPEAIRSFILSFGMSLNDITVPVDVLYTENRKMIDPIANRYFLVMNPVEVRIENAPDVKEGRETLHPDFPEKGKRKIPVNTNKIYIGKEDLEKYKEKTIRLIGLFNIELGKKVRFHSKEVVMKMPKIQWVSEKNVPVKIVMPDGIVKEGIAEPEVKNLKVNEIIQFIRFGFCRVDQTKSYMVFYFTHK